MKPLFKTLPLAAALSTALLASACVPLEQSAPPRGDIYAALHDADLSAFENALVVDATSGRSDHWTDLGWAFLQLANCTKVPPPSAQVRDHRLTHLLYALVRLEDRRRLRLIDQARQAGVRTWHRGTVHTQFTSATFFDRAPASLDDSLIRWPQIDDETWADERPAPIEIAYRCDRLMDRDPPPPPSGDFQTIGQESVSAQLLDEWDRSDQALSALRELPTEPSPPVDNLRDETRQKLLAHRADLALLIGDQEDIQDEAAQTSTSLRQQALEALIAEDIEAFALPVARLADALDRPELLIEAYGHLRDHDNPQLAAVAHYMIVKTAWMQGWWEIAADQPLTPLDATPSLRSAHAYFLATANRYDDRIDRFFGIARTALRDRQRRSDDPFLGALYREVLRALVDFEVDERTLELLEELGPRHELDQRRIEFAEVALDMGRPDVASTIIAPLMGQTDDARRLPRLHALQALIAFMENDRPEFTYFVGLLADRPAELRQVIPRNRRAAFFANQDGELARVLRATLPLMAEWGDDPATRRRRRQWLEIVVEQTQRFVRQAPDSVVSRELRDLYRLAGRLLDDHPRGYAERVGSEEASASPLVLGTIDVPPAPPLEFAPTPALRWPHQYSLLFIPHQGLPPADFVEALKTAEERRQDGDDADDQERS